MFEFKDIISSDQNIIVQELPPIQAPTYEYERLSVPGRDGTYTIKSGLKSIPKRVKAHYYGDRIEFMKEWLYGSGKVKFGNELDRYYEAQILDEVEFSEIIPNYLYRFDVTFVCEPLGYLIDGLEMITLTAADRLYHGQATYISKPYIKIYGSGDINLYINNRTTPFKGVTDFIEIDSKIPNCYKTVNGVKNNTNDLMYTINFPYLDAGENTVSWSGNVSKVEIIPRWCSR